MIAENGGTRKFERVSRWNAVDYTIITRKSIHAPYTDNVDSKDDKLFLTYFKQNNHIVPVNKYVVLPSAIKLTDGSVLSRYDSETGCYLEVAKDKSKIRIYKEIME